MMVVCLMKGLMMDTVLLDCSVVDGIGMDQTKVKTNVKSNVKPKPKAKSSVKAKSIDASVSAICNVYNPHTRPSMDDCDDEGWTYGCFMDPGIRNMAIRFSRAHKDNDIVEGMSQHKIDFDLAKGRVADKKIVSQQCQIGISNDRYARMVRTFKDMTPQFSQCHYIVIEQQLEKIAKLNVMIMNWMLGILSTILIDQGNLPIIIVINSTQKSRPLGAPIGMSKPNLKEWCFEKSFELLDLNGGEFDKRLAVEMSYKTKTGRNKGDDDADVICYCYVWWRHYIFTGLINKRILCSIR